MAALIAVLLLLAIAAVAWRWWSQRQAQEQAQSMETAQQIDALDQRLDSVRRDQRTLTQRVQDAAATNRVLRDEVLGLGQRGALLEESVAKLSDPSRHGAQALRLDEVELLLSLAQQRLLIADDLEGARRAYALAAGALDGIDDHRLLNLKQVLQQERQALDALGPGPRAQLEKQLDAFALSLDGLPTRTPAASQAASGSAWQRWLAPLVQVRASRDAAFVSPTDRGAGEAALRIEVSLAHAALERDDRAGFDAALTRMDHWLLRLWPDSPDLRQGRAQLAALRKLPLRAESPVLGSTLQQLRSLRNAGVASRPLPSTTNPAVPPPVETPEQTP
ncbi:uroporphyrin-3 C-methyltransferase [Pseudoxanthomonas indica]|uniref:Uroporphyrin-3 C-methyltransferase n=1 Tax=Pseudoxanthomonas indica TaxID=428993 RepID=A0A1T5KTL2_9GAMM|nr:uroporphyrin-III C-methyltransferase [Pseudoxanthomonas indica]SKC66739.1 uroporphyrin-3 C-methyltransferase [Pseudoxanthomonas indica]